MLNHLLTLAGEIAGELNAMDVIDSAALPALMERYDVTEINVIDENGFITATTYPDFMNYDMRSGAQSAAFMVLLSGETSYVQSYQPVSYDATISRKYGGVALARGGFVQVGYGAERFQRDIGNFVVGVTRNRHVGEGGEHQHAAARHHIVIVYPEIEDVAQQEKTLQVGGK